MQFANPDLQHPERRDVSTPSLSAPFAGWKLSLNLCFLVTERPDTLVGIGVPMIRHSVCILGPSTPLRGAECRQETTVMQVLGYLLKQERFKPRLASARLTFENHL